MIAYATYYLEIEVAEIYAERLCGLGGEFNNNPGDDFKSRNGVVETSLSQFANSWLFDDPSYR
jgi:hypothetical protein